MLGIGKSAVKLNYEWLILEFKQNFLLLFYMFNALGIVNRMLLDFLECSELAINNDQVNWTELSFAQSDSGILILEFSFYRYVLNHKLLLHLWFLR